LFQTAFILDLEGKNFEKNNSHFFMSIDGLGSGDMQKKRVRILGRIHPGFGGVGWPVGQRTVSSDNA